MPRCTLAIGALILAGCGTTPEPTVVYRTQRVEVPVAVSCPAPEIARTEGPDFAPADSDIYEAAQYAAARIIGLRTEVDALREYAEACSE